jgi:dTDP-4-dehydrorhamnose reductase
MRVLILGGGGMLGHKLLQVLRDGFETWTTVRSLTPRLCRTNLFDPARTITGVHGEDLDALLSAFRRARPQAVVNAIGIVKQRPDAHDPVQALRINSLLPQQVARLCEVAGARFIHVSTDCVFSGRTGAYVETDQPDAEDLYGRSKLLGEVTTSGSLTLRTSMIGREIAAGSGLVEWFLGHDGPRVPGFTRARFSGLTTLALARVIGDVLREQLGLSGLYHVAAQPISKFELLQLLGAAFARPVNVDPVDDPAIDRTLDGSRFNAATGFSPAPWTDMIAEMAGDPTPYDTWRR